MRLGALLATLVLSSLVLSGCSGGRSSAPAGGDGLGEDVEVEVTDTTGAIRGVVVDEAIRPLRGANVTLLTQPPQVATTNDGGTFVFSRLDPGTYFLEAELAGFNSVQHGVEVVAADAEPDVVRLLLTKDLAALPYHSGQVQTGYIMCTTGIAAACGAPNIISNMLLCPAFQVCQGDLTQDRFGLRFYFDPNGTMVQGEMVWDSTQPISPRLTLSAESLGATPEECPPLELPDSPTELPRAPYEEGVSGESPIVIVTDEAELRIGSIGGTCPIFYSVFAGDVQDLPVGFTIQQSFDIYADYFFGYTPPEGWRLSESPPPAPPGNGGP